MPRKMSSTLRKRSLSLLPMLALLILFTQAQQTLAASSNASVFLSVPSTTASDFQPDSATPATASLLGVTGNAKSVLSTGSVGVGIDMLPTSPFGSYRANASWIDNWSASGGVATVPVSATLTLNGAITPSLLTSYAGFFDLQFIYSVNGNSLFLFDMTSDGDPTRIRAFGNGIDISSSFTSTFNPITGLTDFSVSYTTPTLFLPLGFSDSLVARLTVDGGEGPLTIDAFHSLHTNLTSLDPNVILTDEGGRSAALAVPEPETYAMLLAGLGLLGFKARRRKQQVA